MRTLFAQILLWFGCTVAITLVGSAFLSELGLNPGADEQETPAARLVALAEEVASWLARQ